VTFEHPDTARDRRRSVWMPQYHVVDRLVLPLQKLVGKG
jgi:hypothetical protein